MTSGQLVEVKYQFKLGCLDPGLEAVKQALAGGHTVTALVRNPSKLEAVAHPNLTVVEADVLQAESLAPHLPGQDAVLSCLGFPHNQGPVT